MSYKVQVSDRQYLDFEYLDIKTLKKTIDDLKKTTLEMKLFNQDIIDENYNILHSSVRSMRFIPGVLVVGDGKTYGRSGGCIRQPYFWYRCIPDDRRLPEFLVSYRIKDDFSKYVVNKYIVFNFINQMLLKLYFWFILYIQYMRGKTGNVLGAYRFLDVLVLI